ncbi:MAG: hypothetical protein NVSMB2_07420 [Chloroflexota bacterium]
MYHPDLAILHMAGDTEPLDFAAEVRLVMTDNANLRTVFPHHNRVNPPPGQTRVEDVQAALDGLGIQMHVSQPPVGEAVMFP